MPRVHTAAQIGPAISVDSVSSDNKRSRAARLRVKASAATTERAASPSRDNASVANGATQRVYIFGKDKSQGSASMKNLVRAVLQQGATSGLRAFACSARHPRNSARN